MAFSILLTPLFFLIFGLNLAVFHLIQVVARNLFGSKAHDATVAILNLFLMRSLIVLGTSIKFKEFKSHPANTPLIIISNHQSMWDIPPLLWKYRKHHPKFVAKKELSRGIPSISYNLKYGGSVSIDRKNPEEAIQKIKAFAKMIEANNLSVCIFPEGTRSRDGKIKPFKVSGVATLLEEMPNALVLPVAIKNTGLIDNKGKFLKKLGVKVTFTELKPRKVSLSTIEKDLEEINKEIRFVLEG